MAERDIQLLDQVLLKLALSKEEQLEKIINDLLVLILDKLSIDNTPPLRAKVFIPLSIITLLSYPYSHSRS